MTLPLHEIIAATLSATSVWLGTRRSPWCYPAGLVSVSVYIWVYFGARLYSEVLLQCIWIGMLVLGSAGGVGVAAIQVAKAMGAKVVAMVHRVEALDFVAAVGADDDRARLGRIRRQSVEVRGRRRMRGIAQ